MSGALRRRWVWAAFWSIHLLWLCSGGPVHAQRRPREAKQERASSAESAGYRALIDEGLSEFDRGNWNEALALFQRAHALEPNARTLRGIGFCLFEMRRYVAAVAHLEQAMTDTRSPLGPSQRGSTQEVLDRARGFVAHVEVRLTPSGARLLIDGQEPSAQGSLLALDPGEHELYASAEGYAQRSLHVSLQSGANEAIVLELSPIAALEPSAPTAEPAAPAREDASSASGGRARLKRGLMIGGFGLAGAGLISGAVTGILTLVRKNDLEKRCPDDLCPPEEADALDRANGLALGSTLSFVAAAVGVGVGLTGLLLKGDDRRRAERARLELRVGASSLALSGTF